MANLRSVSDSKSPAPKLRQGAVPAKRKKPGDISQSYVHQACSVCKARKARCDSRRPRCSFCEGRDLECVYPPLYKRALCSQSHVDNLEAQIEQLQAQLQAKDYQPEKSMTSPPPYSSHAQSDSTQQLYVTEKTTSETGCNQNESPAVGPDNLATANSLVPNDTHPPYEQSIILLGKEQQSNPVEGPSNMRIDENNCEEGELSDHVPATDGMVEYDQSSPEQDDTDGRYGDSYSLKFAMRVKASTMPSRLPLPRGVQAQRAAKGLSRRPFLNDTPQDAGQSRDDEDDMIALRLYLTTPSLQDLPNRHLAKQLLDCYFTDVHPVWPFLIEHDTRAELDKTYMSEEPAKPITIAKLNLMFALGCQFSPSLAETGDPVKGASDVGTVFYRTARAFIVANAFNMCSIGMLQALLLMAQYQQGTTRGKQFWLTISHATRIAQCLGFHLDSHKATLSALDRELGRRLWWGCFSLDRVASMVYGRQPIISLPKHCIPALPQPVDDIFIRDGANFPEGSPSMNSFFHSTVRLYLVMDNVMEILQEINRRSEPDSDLATKCSSLEILMAVLKSDEKLLTWHSSLPDYLRFSLHNTEQYDTSQPRWIQRCKVILKNRFLGLRILLHRQTVLFLLQPSQSKDDTSGPVCHWLPLFSDFIHGQATWDTSVRPVSDLERPLAYLSAKTCIQSARQQIDTISACRPARLTGAWWWDFHFTFDSLCVLLAAAALPVDHRADVILDVAAVHGTIRNGLGIIHSLISLGGERARQSEQFLQQLHKVAYTMKDQALPETLQSNTAKTRESQPAQPADTVGSVLPPENMTHASAVDVWSESDMPMDCMGVDAAVNLDASRYFSTNTVGDLLHSSFSWNAFDYLSETSPDFGYGPEMVGGYWVSS